MTVCFDNKTIAGDGFTEIMHAIRQAVFRQQRFNRVAIRGTHLNYRPQLFVKQRRQTVVAQRGDVRFHAAVAGKGHLCQRNQQAAV
ncbi:hypothetical protein D3C71_1661060 [compost metagenome]